MRRLYATTGFAFALLACAGHARAAPVVLPADTEVRLALTAPMSTRTIKPGDEFALRTVAPIVLDGVERLPAGVPARGQVVHAQKAGYFGKAAELILTVRRLDFAGQAIPMHKLEPATGRDHTNAVAAMSFAPVVGLFAPFVHGGQIELPAGTEVVSYVARDTELAPPADPPPPDPTESETQETEKEPRP